jgi:dihydroorotate dehydrogenase (fumarate)
MDLGTTYMGLELACPIVPGASPLADDLDRARRLEEAGAGALVMRSLFEEQIINEMFREEQDVQAAEYTFNEALTYLPRTEEYRTAGIDRYLEHLGRLKEAVSIPVIASLNGISLGAWKDFAAIIEEVGADALELNIYYLAADPLVNAAQVEEHVVRTVETVCGAVSIPVAVKLSPFYSSLPNLAAKLAAAGAHGIVIFNRFYQPDIDPEELRAVPRLQLSDPSELLLRLRWLAVLRGRTDLSLGATGGVHSAIDAVKAIMAGADAVQMVSALLLNGVEYVGEIIRDLDHWLEHHEYESIAQMKGSMSLAKTADPAAFERANYLRVLEGGIKYV